MPTSGPPEHPWLIPATHNRGNAPRPPATWRSFCFSSPFPDQPTTTQRTPSTSREETRSCKPSSTPPFTPPSASRTSLGGHRACRAVPNAADLFFSEDIGDIAAAKRVRRLFGAGRVPRSALDRRELFGVWGGQLFINGKMLTVKRRRGRPRRSPVRGPDAGRADSGASAGHRPEAVRLSPSQPGGGVVPGPRHPTIPHRPPRRPPRPG